jgi:single-strand DNA-binding protein
MNGLHCAFTGRLGTDPELRYTTQGKMMLGFSVVVDENTRQTEERPEPAETTWVRVTAWEEKAAELQERGLKKGALVYCEGRLKLDRWTAANGEARSSLKCSAWTVQPLGQIGQRRAPTEQGSREPVSAGASRQDLEDLPF